MSAKIASPVCLLSPLFQILEKLASSLEGGMDAIFEELSLLSMLAQPSKLQAPYQRVALPAAVVKLTRLGTSGDGAGVAQAAALKLVATVMQEAVENLARQATRRRATAAAAPVGKVGSSWRGRPWGMDSNLGV